MELLTALLIIPPPEVQAFAAPLRQKYATEVYMQGPAHITLFYPFISPAEIPATVTILKSLCSDIAPFKLTLDRYGHFEGTHYLALTNPEAVLSLHKSLLTAFPDYLPYEGQYGAELIPHLTLAHNENPEVVKSVALPQPPSFTFIVDQLYLYLGFAEGNIPWIPVAIIPLGGKM
jgi:2'-5' RNA ligase